MVQAPPTVSTARKPTRSYSRAAGLSFSTLKLTRAGRRQLKHAKRLRLTARGAFTLASGATVKAARRFTLRR